MFFNFIFKKWTPIAIFRIETSILMFKYNFDNLNYNFLLKHIFLNKTNNFMNSYLKFQIQIYIS